MAEEYSCGDKRHKDGTASVSSMAKSANPSCVPSYSSSTELQITTIQHIYRQGGYGTKKKKKRNNKPWRGKRYRRNVL